MRRLAWIDLQTASDALKRHDFEFAEASAELVLGSQSDLPESYATHSSFETDDILGSSAFEAERTDASAVYVL